MVRRIFVFVVLAHALLALVLAAQSPSPTAGLTADAREGREVFLHETFGGNDRTCATCHRLEDNGTINPEIIATLGPSDTVFRAIDSDDGTGATYNRLRERAAFNVTIDLGPWVRDCANLTATTAVVRRSVPSNFNSSLETFLTWDGHQPDLQSQALGAIMGHFEPTRAPTAAELSGIVTFQEQLFNRPEVRTFARDGTVPVLPDGETDSERRGREFFRPNRQCGICHSGPMLNQTSEFHPDVTRNPDIRPEGSRWDRNVLPNFVGPEAHRWCLFNPSTGQFDRFAPIRINDPGVGTQRNPPRPIDIGTFKIPTLWGVSETAPYFHDGSLPTLQAVMDHYNVLFAGSPAEIIGGGSLTPSEQQDVIAFLRLLRPRADQASAHVDHSQRD